MQMAGTSSGARRAWITKRKKYGQCGRRRGCVKGKAAARNRKAFKVQEMLARRRKFGRRRR